MRKFILFGFLNKYEVLIAAAQIHIIWFLLFIVYLALFVFLLFSDAPYIVRGISTYQDVCLSVCFKTEPAFAWKFVWIV